MRKFLLIAGLAATLCVKAADPTFSVDFTASSSFSEQDFQKWTVVDANEDSKTWVFSADGSPSRVYYNYHNKNMGNDWFISPAITIPAAGTYLVRYNCTGSSYGEAIEVYYGNDATVAAMTKKGSEIPDIKGNPTSGYFVAEFKAGEKVHLGFHAVSPADRFRLYLNTVSVQPVSNPVDLGVEKILSPVSGEGLGQETVKVKVKNYMDKPVNGFDISFKINDGTPVKEHSSQTIGAGETIEYTFTATADCSTPRGKYDITVFTSAPDDVAPENDSKTVTVKHIAPAGIPYSNGFEPDDDCSNFTFLNLNNDDGDWSVGVNSFFSNFSRTGEGYLAYNYNKQNKADDWVFIDPMEIEAGDYLMRFWYSATPNHTERLKVCWGTAPTPEAMTNEICRIDPMTNDEYMESVSLFKIPASQKVFIGFYAYSDADENWLMIDDLSIEKIDPDKFDIVVSALSEPGTYIRKNNRRDVVTTVRNIGVKDAAVAINLYIDGSLKESRQETVGFMATKEIKFENALTGLPHGKHTVKVEAVNASDPDNSNNVAEKDVVVLDQQPVLVYDFENEEFPADIVYRVEDSAAIHPSAQNMYGDKGMALLGVNDHYLYNKTVLALCTWFTESDKSADRWLVLPQLHINADNCHVSWDASAFSTSAYEDYELCVSTEADKWYDYNAIYSVKGEDEWSKTHGVSLGAYNGKDIYIAFHLKTKGGNALILDNIGIYGDAKKAGVEGVSVSELSLICEGNTLLCNTEARIAVTAMNGMRVAEGNGTTLDISTLPAGIYIATATVAGDSRTIKFVKK